MTLEQLAELERRLSLSLPVALREHLLDGDASCGPVAAERYDGYRSLLVWNLRHRDEVRPAPWPAHFLAVGNSGCGDEYLVDTSDAAASVWMHDHERGELVFVCRTFTEFAGRLATPEINDDGWATLAADAVMASRAALPDDSILHPIAMEEWRALVSQRSDLDLPGRRIYPLQGVPRSIEPGVAVWYGPRGQEVLSLEWGALLWQRPSEAGLGVLAELAEQLEARVFLGWDRPPRFSFPTLEGL